MTAAFARKVAARTELTGSAQQDRAQQVAQQVAKAHEVTKATVQALANTSYATLTTDTTIASGSYATLLTARITTVLASGYLDVSFSAAGLKTTAAGGMYFQILLDGAVVKGLYFTCTTFPQAWNVSQLARVAVTRGSHTVSLQWRTDASSAHVNPATVVEEHAALLVREMP